MLILGLKNMAMFWQRVCCRASLQRFGLWATRQRDEAAHARITIMQPMPAMRPDLLKAMSFDALKAMAQRRAMITHHSNSRPRAHRWKTQRGSPLAHILQLIRCTTTCTMSAMIAHARWVKRLAHTRLKSNSCARAGRCIIMWLNISISIALHSRRATRRRFPWFCVTASAHLCASAPLRFNVSGFLRLAGLCRCA